MGNRKLTEKEYWEKEKNSFRPYKVSRPSYWSILERYLPQSKNMTCAEIGAYPGRFLVNFVKSFGYKPVAIEYSPSYKDIGTLLEYNDIRDYQLINDDLFNLNEEVKYDVVASFGFVEHFEDLTDIIAKHVNLLNKEGYIVIGMPYIGGLQGWIRKMVFTNEGKIEVKQTHNLASMNLLSLISAMKNNNIDVLFADYVSKATIWLEPSSHLVRKDRRWLLILMKCIERVIGPFVPSSAIWSPYILVIGKSI